MLLILILFCISFIIVETTNLFKNNRIKEMKVYILLLIILVTISTMTYFDLIPRKLLKSLSSFFIGK